MQIDEHGERVLAEVHGRTSVGGGTRGIGGRCGFARGFDLRLADQALIGDHQGDKFTGRCGNATPRAVDQPVCL